jgi:inosine-uridine nucleoside N-ribohydrolase
LSPSETWKTVFNPPPPGSTEAEIKEAKELAEPTTSFIPSTDPSHKEILRLLRENEPDTITIVAVGPLTNLALAAAEDTETFLRVKEVVVMGGAIDIQGNITPVAEFNTYADAVATARVFALTSPTPSSTMPPPPPPAVIEKIEVLPPYPKKLSKQLKLTLFPLDITELHLLPKSAFDAKVKPLIEAGSPLAEWTSVFMGKTFDKINSMTNGYADPGLSLHDPLTMWYMLTRFAPSWIPAPKGPEDIRVETAGQWTRGMHIIDRRNRRKQGAPVEKINGPGAINVNNPLESGVSLAEEADDPEANVPGDEMGWLSWNKGNRINRIVSSPGEDAFAPYLLERIFG